MTNTSKEHCTKDHQILLKIRFQLTDNHQCWICRTQPQNMQWITQKLCLQ